jgi:hypothetical protein
MKCFHPRRVAGLARLLAASIFAVLLTQAANAQAPTMINNFVPTSTPCTASGGSFNVYLCTFATLSLTDTLTGASVPLPNGTTQGVAYSTSATPTIPWVVLPAGASVTLPYVSSIQASNTSFKVRVIAQTSPASGYTSVLGMSSSTPGGAQFVIGQHGSDWTYGRTTDTPNSTTAYWMTPWDVTDPYPTQSNVYETLYYTFLPNGRLRIDMLTPYFASTTSNTLSYSWYEAIEDGGWPLANLAGAVANNGANGSTLPVLPAGSVFVGAPPSSVMSLFGKNDPSTIPTTTGVGIVGVSLYSSAFVNTTDMLSDFMADLNSPAVSSTLSKTLLSCNTGYYLVQDPNKDTNPIKYTFPITTPCGSVSSASSPVPAPVSANAAGVGLGYAPSNLVLQNVNAAPTVLVSWQPPMASGANPSSYTVVLWGDGYNQSITTTGTSLALNPSNSIVGYNTVMGFNVTANYASRLPANTNTSAIGKIQVVPGAVTNFSATSSPGTLNASWGAPNFEAPAASYTVTLNTSGYGAPLQTITVLGNANASAPTSASFSGLVPNKAYTISVQPAANASGAGIVTTSSSFNIPDLPWTQCSGEGGTCAVSAGSPVLVQYTSAANPSVAPGSTNSSFFLNASSNVSCSNNTFGDPTPYLGKVCYTTPASLLPVAPDSTWTFCAYEGSSCSIPNDGQIAYGTTGNWQTVNTSQINLQTYSYYVFSLFGQNTYSSAKYFICSASAVSAQTDTGVGACFYKATSSTVAPRGLASLADTAGPASLTATWPTPADDGTPVFEYTVTLVNDGVNVGSVNVPDNSPNTNSYTFTGLNPGASYWVTVTPVNADDFGPTATGNSIAPQAALWIPCAAEGGTCTITTGGAAVVQYSANGNSFYQNISTSSIGCNNSVFGDPASGYTKSCFFIAPANLPPAPDNSQPYVNGSPTAGQWTFCSYERGTCSYNGSGWIAWGVAGSFTYTPAPSTFPSGYSCSFSTFGYDPAPGRDKVCYFKNVP